MKVGVVGTGYVGLVTGTCFAEKGNEVTCVDIDEAKINALQDGVVPIYEPRLEELVKNNTNRGNLTFTTDLAEGVSEAAVTFLALPTPEAEDGSADLKHVLGVARDIGRVLTDYSVIVTKSTVPPGTAEKVQSAIFGGLNDDELRFDVASNPEFLKEGNAIEDFQHPDRVVLGVNSDKAWQVLRELYLPFFPNREEFIIRTDIPTAEMIKYASNTFLAARVALTAEIANISELFGADARKVLHAVGLDKRIGPDFLNPGPGYGGSCFPKDVQALEKAAAEHGYEFVLGKATHEANQRQKKRLFEKLQDYFVDGLEGKTIAIWGLSFKPNTDDIRETPATNVINSLLTNKANVVAYDPQAMENMKRLYAEGPNLSFAEDRYGALKNADALVIVTDWDEFKTPDWERMKSLMSSPVVIDGRSLYESSQMEDRGFYYDSIGRPVVHG